MNHCVEMEYKLLLEKSCSVVESDGWKRSLLLQGHFQDNELLRAA